MPDGLDNPLPIADAIFAEADMTPEALLQVIKRVIGYMGYPLDTFKILLSRRKTEARWKPAPSRPSE